MALQFQHTISKGCEQIFEYPGEENENDQYILNEQEKSRSRAKCDILSDSDQNNLFLSDITMSPLQAFEVFQGIYYRYKGYINTCSDILQ